MNVAHSHECAQRQIFAEEGLGAREPQPKSDGEKSLVIGTASPPDLPSASLICDLLLAIRAAP